MPRMKKSSAIVVQEDGAPGHGYVGRTKNPTAEHRKLDEAAKKDFIVSFRKQPANSSETNVNDVGLYHSI